MAGFIAFARLILSRLRLGDCQSGVFGHLMTDALPISFVGMARAENEWASTLKDLPARFVCASGDMRAARSHKSLWRKGKKIFAELEFCVSHVRDLAARSR